jgi:serine/threonine protein kinase
VKVQTSTNQRINLNKNNFIANGGEGSIYVYNGKAFKIYTDSSKAISQGKIQELSAITLPNIIKPEEILLSTGRNKTPIGYTMKYVTNSTSICPVFTKGFKRRNNITPIKVLGLVKKLQEGVQHVHQKNILIVDLNEMNFLTDNKLSNIYFIDVDSYQTPSYPATALMDSVKDWHANGVWTKESDWFSWGIISFQLFIGIHPYKGKYPSMNMEERMKSNISVFNKNVSVPKVAESFDTIPQAYRDWYKAVFEDGVRVAPPTDPVTVVHTTMAAKPIVSSIKLNITNIWTATTQIKSYYHIGQWNIVTTTDNEVHFSKSKRINLTSQKDAQYLFLSTDGKLIGGTIVGHQIELHDVETNNIISPKLQCSNAMTYNNHLYIQNQDKILEIEVKSIGSKLLSLLTIVSNTAKNATTMFDGVVLQNMLGTWYATIFPESKRSFQNRLQELDGYRVIDAKYMNRILVVIGQKNGKYDRFIYLARPDNYKFSLFNHETNISYHGINFTVLDNGVAVMIDENEDILVFTSQQLNTFKKIKDPIISGDMALYNNGTEILFCCDTSLKKVSMK